MNGGNIKYFYITSIISSQNLVVEKLLIFSSKLYHITIKPVESYVVMNQKFNDSKKFYPLAWHTRLPKVFNNALNIEHSHEHPLKKQEILLPNEYSCDACLQSKLIVGPFFTKIIFESPIFLEGLHGGTCGSIHPPCGSFRCFMILINVFTRWSHVCLLSTCNVVFARLLAQMIRLQSQFPNYSIKTIRLNNVDKFTSQTFINYCMSVWINIEYFVVHTHTQNGLAESFINVSN